MEASSNNNKAELVNNLGLLNDDNYLEGNVEENDKHRMKTTKKIGATKKRKTKEEPDLRKQEKAETEEKEDKEDHDKVVKNDGYADSSNDDDDPIHSEDKSKEKDNLNKKSNQQKDKSKNIVENEFTIDDNIFSDQNNSNDDKDKEEGDNNKSKERGDDIDEGEVDDDNSKDKNNDKDNYKNNDKNNDKDNYKNNDKDNDKDNYKNNDKNNDKDNYKNNDKDNDKDNYKNNDKNNNKNNDSDLGKDDLSGMEEEKKKKKRQKLRVKKKRDDISDCEQNEEDALGRKDGKKEMERRKKNKKKLKGLKRSKFIDSVAEEGELSEEDEHNDNEDEDAMNDDVNDNDNYSSLNSRIKKKEASAKKEYSGLGLDDEDEDEDEEDEEGEGEYENDMVYSNKTEKKKKTHFDEILENLKLKRKRVQKISEDDGLQYCENVLNQMILMHEQDIKNMKEKKPATAKLQIIDQVCKILTKPKWKPFFMKLNIYHVLALWLMPLSKNTLPNFTIRTNLLRVIQQLPITIKSLRGSQLGKIMTYLHTHKDETDENKKLIRNILQNWMGPIIGINTNYKQFLKERQKRIVENPEYHKKVLEKAKTLIPDSISIEKEEEQNEFKRHATVPYNSECSFLINVPSSVPNSSKKIIPKSKIKRLIDNMKLLKRSRKSQKVSIEGKGVAIAP
ncbi:IWS1-like protein, putative [Plasmodium malariae]|uniref:IWS1-like protein, putative n=1 Tax=Plasmodium malariae TaxID=5858 RepID=A0A1C3KCA1_PLAMA|nr:IWS1-like protein, putative [Plasmodium malariae]